tara:strand:+ start:234 stop:506 length:273 start_codon:yes stop_codon:yes gene_type:complete
LVYDDCKHPRLQEERERERESGEDGHEQDEEEEGRRTSAAWADTTLEETPHSFKVSKDSILNRMRSKGTTGSFPICQQEDVEKKQCRVSL